MREEVRERGREKGDKGRKIKRKGGRQKESRLREREKKDKDNERESERERNREK